VRRESEVRGRQGHEGGGMDGMKAGTISTEADFERLSWHDCTIWAIGFRAGDPDRGDWTSELVLDIDFLVEWICGVDGKARFKIAPATLVFRDLTDPKISIDWGRTGFQSSLHPVSIHAIERERVQEQKICFDRPYYSWRIPTNWPEGGEVSFGASGFTQTLRAEPVLTENQHLPWGERDHPIPG
jgi:hypothetical protein